MSSKFFQWAGKQKGYRHNLAAYNAFAYCLNRNNRFWAADELPELMQMQGKPPTEKQFEILIRMHTDANRGLRVYYVYQKMKKFGIKPRVYLYNRVMDSLVRTGLLHLAMSVYEDFRENGLAEESVTFMILIKGLCKEGRIDDVLELLSRMRENLCKPDVFAYTAMVKVLIAEGHLDGCLRVWEEMQRDKVEPDAMAYMTLIKSLCTGKRVQRGYEFFMEMKEKGHLIDRAIYGSLIEAFVEDGKVGSAFDLFKDLMDSNYRADLSIYNSLIQGLCSVNKVDKAYKLFQITIQEDLEPDSATVNPMLMSYAGQQRMDDFCKLLKQLEKLNFPVMDGLSNFFSFMVQSEERIPTALAAFEHLRAASYCSISIYNILMEALHKAGDVGKVLSLFNGIKGLNFTPNAPTYSIVIPCFIEVEDIEQACSCYNKIKEMSCVPSVSAYRSLSKGLCRIGEIDAAIMVVRDCLANMASSPQEFKYVLTVIHVSRLGGAEKVIEVINEMMQQGCPPDEVIYSAIISGMCKHRRVEEARKVFAHMRERNLLTEANTIVCEEKLMDYLDKKTAGVVASAVKFFGLESKLKRKGRTFLSYEDFK